jgi:hypothetical protein
VTSLVDEVENGEFVLPANSYPGPANSWFKTPSRVLEYIAKQTGVSFGRATSALNEKGDYVVFNRMVDGNPTHVMWARVGADGKPLFFDPQAGSSPTASSVGRFSAYPIVSSP